MSAQITTAFVQQYNSNVLHLSQQKGSRLQPYVRNEMQKGDSQYFDRIGAVAAVLRTGRHASTPQLDTPHSRRKVSMQDYEWADLVDDQDKIRMLIDPTSEYALSAAWAFGRSKDDVIIASSIADAYGAVDGSSTVAHPNSQKYAANDGTSLSDLNVTTLRGVKKMFGLANVDPSIPLNIAVSSNQIAAMLGQTAVTSSDFNTVKALVQGEVDTFMGFKFIEINRLATTAARSAFSGSATTGAVGSGTSLVGANFRSCFAWAQDGLLLATGENFVTKMSERDDKGYSMQVYARMSIGATRMEEEKVVEIICKES